MISDARFKRGQVQPQARLNTRSRDLVAYSTMAVVIVVLLLALVSKENDFFHMGYEITQLRKETTSLREEQLELRAQLTELKRPDKLLAGVMALGLKPLPSSNRVAVYSMPKAETGAEARGMLAKLEGGE